ncbi:hypothetical protein QYF61_013390 [Mycteria americana]|uniref:Uncharacterized protein n=1 Tax=Mycteria americana TaxID=33587 RepID=A0AAN7ML40_MYCAM|nr:hypothetical protein QYF61_013390 [Mycteria americana]
MVPRTGCSITFPGIEDPELHHLMVTAAKAAFDLHIPNEPLLVGEQEVQQSTSPHWLLCHLGEEVVIDALQELPGLLMPCSVVPPADIETELHTLQLLFQVSSTLGIVCLKGRDTVLPFVMD